MLAVLMHLSAASTVILNFETFTIPSTISSWKNYTTAGSSGSTWSTPNPLMDVVNGTADCYKVTKKAGDVYWTGLEINLASPIKITTTTQYLHVFVFKNTSSRIALTYTPTIGNQSPDTWQTNNIAGCWLDYVLPVPIDSTIKTISIKIADDPGDYYIDEISLSDSPASISKTLVAINPAKKNQIMEGWGVSLCWWANVEGGRATDAQLKTFCDYLTDPVNGLNMNIFRYNIGGGDDPSHTHLQTGSEPGSNMPGYKASATATYDWTQDGNQRRVANQLIASRIAKAGVNDIKWVAFSNSPPYWMTNSGCSSGSTAVNKYSTNLKSTMYATFADYLTEVVRYYHDSYGITFDYIEPFNEPDGWWWNAMTTKQEGCYFALNDQLPMIRELYAKLSEKNMLSYCQITANDENDMNNYYSALLAYNNADDIIPKIPLLSVHSYSGSQRAEIANFAKLNNKKLWQSETGGGGHGDTSFKQQVMSLSNRLISDLRDLKCTAWCDWQAGWVMGDTPASAWSLIDGLVKGVNFSIRAQYSRYIKAGYTIINNDASNVVTAISPDEKELVIVASNKNTYTQKFLFDLSKFSNIGKVKQIRTRADPALTVKNSLSFFTVSGNSFSYDALSESVTTFIIPINQSPSALIDFKQDNVDMFYSEGLLHTNFNSVNLINLSIYNTLGCLVKQIQKVQARGTQEINLKSGYYIILTYANDRTYSKKIIVH